MIFLFFTLKITYIEYYTIHFYKKNEWCNIWDKIYKDFLKNNKKKLWKFRYHFRGLKEL